MQFGAVQDVAGLQILHTTARNGQVQIFIHAEGSTVVVAEPHWLRRKLFACFQRIHGFEETEAPGQQFLAFGFTTFKGTTAHHGRDQTHLAFSGRGHQVVTGFIGMTCFDTVNVQAVIPQQAVTVGLTNTVEGKLFLFIDGVFVRYVADQGLTNQCHITCGAVLTVCIQAVYGLEMAVFQTQRGDVAVHQADEGILATGGEISHCYAGIVT